MPQTLSRQDLLTLSRRGPLARFIGLAPRALSAEPGDDEVRMALVRALTQHGMPERALDELERLTAAVRRMPAVEGLAQNLRGMPPGRIGWETRSGVFLENLALVRARWAFGPALEAGWAATGEALELYSPPEMGWQIWDRRENRWRPGYARRPAEAGAAALEKSFRNKIAPPVVFEGLGLGEAIAAVAEATRHTFLDASSEVHLIEPSFEALAVSLHLHDWSGLLREARIHLYAGPTAYQDFENKVAGARRSHAPSVILRGPAWEPVGAEALESAGERAVARIQARIEANRARLVERYAERDAGWWGRRFAAALDGEAEPLRIMAITCRFTTVLQYSTRDMLRSFEQAGCRTKLLIEGNGHERMNSETKLEAIEEFEPDLVFVIDHLRQSDPLGIIENVPVLTWVQDRLPWLFNASAGSSIGPLDFCMGYAAGELTQRFGYPRERFLSCEMATNPSELGGPESIDEDAATFACDVAYMSHQSHSPEQQWRECREKSPPRLHAIIDAVRDEIFGRAGQGRLSGNYDFEALLLRIERDLKCELALEERTQLIDMLARPMADRLLRHETLRWAARWAESRGRRLHLYGNGWERHAEFSRYARGALPHGRAIGAAFRAARVSLHTGCNPAFHQRVLDGLAAGGLYLFRSHPADHAAALTRAVMRLIEQRGATLPIDLRPADLGADGPAYAALLESAGREREGYGVLTAEAWRATAEKMRNGEPLDASEVWPEWPRVVFADESDLHARLDGLTSDDASRRELADAMRGPVLANYTYDGLVRRVLPWLRERLGGAELCEAGRLTAAGAI